MQAKLAVGGHRVVETVRKAAEKQLALARHVAIWTARATFAACNQDELPLKDSMVSRAAAKTSRGLRRAAAAERGTVEGASAVDAPSAWARRSPSCASWRALELQPVQSVFCQLETPGSAALQRVGNTEVGTQG